VHQLFNEQRSTLGIAMLIRVMPSHLGALLNLHQFFIYLPIEVVALDRSCLCAMSGIPTRQAKDPPS